jgi:hypothetical protein
LLISAGYPINADDEYDGIARGYALLWDSNRSMVGSLLENAGIPMAFAYEIMALRGFYNDSGNINPGHLELSTTPSEMPQKSSIDFQG